MSSLNVVPKLLLIGSLLFIGPTMAPAQTGAPAEAAEISVATTVAAAQLYPRGASVTRAAQISAPAGRQVIRIDDLPLNIDPATLRAELQAGDAASLLGIRYRRPQPRTTDAEDPRRRALEAEIRDVGWAIAAADDAIDEAAARQAYVAEFRRAASVASDELGAGGLLAGSDGWAGAWARMAEESMAARADARAARRLREDLERRRADLIGRLQNLAPENPRGALFVTIRADEALEGAPLRLTYLTRAASWRPLYDLRLIEDGDAPTLTVARRAAISQNTGEDWEGVELSLSTARPSGRMAAVEPPAMIARFRPAPRPAAQGAGGLMSAAPAEPAPLSESDEARLDQFTGNMADGLRDRLERAEARPVASREEAAAFAYEGAVATFTAPEPVNLTGDGETSQILLVETSQETELVARTTPSIDQSAYLYASFTDPARPLLPGRASIYRGASFIGRVSLKGAAPGEQAALPMGPLEEIKVSRAVRDRRDGEEGFFSTENTRRERFEITVENLGAVDRRVTVFDATPVSEDGAIVVTPQADPRPSERDVDGARGVMSWTFTLQPGRARTIEVGYEITWPEGREIEVSAERAAR